VYARSPRTTKMLQEILQYVSLSVLALAIFIPFSLIKVVGWINGEKKIQALGGHAPRIGIRLLMGLWLFALTIFLS
jgi:hypothetical protein